MRFLIDVKSNCTEEGNAKFERISFDPGEIRKTDSIFKALEPVKANLVPANLLNSETALRIKLPKLDEDSSKLSDS